ncbi:MAG: hypothetical protein NZV14_13890 [Bryobacteraceae bacterium]|nr:hypothetical protein [Bryobacteraceae bacterium]MDW8379251.1 hypothetical protein [Bryobacterales bacterium]
MLQSSLVDIEGSASSVEGNKVDAAGVVRHLAHELRQPLSTIESSAFYLQVLLQNHPNASITSHLSRIQAGVQHLDWILADFVHYLCSIEPKPQLVDLCEILGGILAEPPFANASEIVFTASDSPILVLLDPAHAQHLVRTAIHVFRQLAAGDQPLRIQLASEGESVLFEVSVSVSRWEGDGGNLFKPFSPHVPSGLGLAFASVQTICEKHRGCARLLAEQKGLRLQVRLPGSR